MNECMYGMLACVHIQYKKRETVLHVFVFTYLLVNDFIRHGLFNGGALVSCVSPSTDSTRFVFPLENLPVPCCPHLLQFRQRATVGHAHPNSGKSLNASFLGSAMSQYE